MELTEINELVANKEFEKAKKELLEIQKQDEKNVEILKLIGLCNVNLGFFEEGRSNFETVVKYKADDATSWFYLANCYDNLEDYLHSKTAYNEVLKLRENYLDAYKNLCVVYIKTHEEPKAIELGKKALKLEEAKDDFTIPYLIGTAFLSMKDFPGSIPFLEIALTKNPNHAQLLNNLGTAYLTSRNYDKSIECYKKACELEPRNGITFYNLGAILQIKNQHKEACEYLQKAYELENDEHFLVALALSQYKGEMFDKAVESYKILSSAHPEKPNFQYNLACCYEKLGEYNFAVGIMAQLVMMNPKSKTMSEKLANLYLKTNQPLKAKEIYKQMITSGIVSPEVYYDYAMVCVITEDLTMAEKILKKVILLTPEYASAHKDLGVIYLKKRLFDYAEDEFKKAYELEPENENMIFEYANYKHSVSDFEGAEELYVKALNKSENNPNFLLFHTMNLIAMNKIHESEHEIEKVMKQLPEDSFVLYLAGKIKYMQKDYDNAQTFIIRSLEKKQTPEVKNLLALNYLAQEQFEKANNIFTSMLKDSPENTNLLLNSAKCYIGMKDYKSAKSKLRKVTKIFPESFEAQDLKDIIKEATKTEKAKK